MRIISCVPYKGMQTREELNIEDAALGSGESFCGEATDEEPMDGEEVYESPYETNDVTTTEAEISEDDGEAEPNKSERLDSWVIKITARDHIPSHYYP